MNDVDPEEWLADVLACIAPAKLDELPPQLGQTRERLEAA